MGPAAAFATVALLIGACAIEPPGPRYTTTNFDATFELTAERPVVVKTLDFRARQGSTEISSVEGFVTVTGPSGGGPSSDVHDDVWVSIVNTASGQSTDGTSGIGHASVDGWGHGVRCDGAPKLVDASIAPDPSVPCESQWTVIVRWLTPQPSVTIPLRLSASMTAHAREFTATSDPLTLQAFSITEATEPAFAGAPALTEVRASGSARITPTSAAETKHFLLQIPAALTIGDAHYPRMGRLFLGTKVTAWTGPPDEGRVKVSIGDRSEDPYGGIAGELDWLSLCKPGADCELSTDVTTEYWESSGSGKTSSPNGAMSIDWTLVVRLEDYTPGATMPATLELVTLP
ncbi:MAG TPA: hypothetical protein VJ850_04405 [Candidatus Limnocylindrales bacterium]|nr:hypothetical protein [Candidatus Limnocylindrales bacterium]